MTETYRVMASAVDDNDAVHVQTVPSNRLRCTNWLLCNFFSPFIALSADLLLFAMTIWLYADIFQALVLMHMITAGNGWWFYPVLIAPLIFQWSCIVLRIRYACAKQNNERSRIDWHLLQAARPHFVMMVNGIAVSVFLFVMPLYGTALSLEVPNRLTVAWSLQMWQVTADTPSSIAFTVTFFLSTYINWRLSAYHTGIVKHYILTHQGRPPVGASLGAQMNAFAGARGTAGQTETVGMLPGKSLFTIRDEVVDDDNGKPRPKGTNGKSRPKASGNTRKGDAFKTVRPGSASGSGALDHATRSAGETWQGL